MNKRILSLFVVSIFYHTTCGTNYYVNDASLTGDVYTTAPGAAYPGNNGLSPATPVSTINAIVSNYILTANDSVFIDAGTYNNTQVVLSGADAGSAAGNLVFIGADSSLTRVFALAAINSAVFDLTNTSYVTIGNMFIQTANNRQCISLDGNSDYCEIYNCYLYNPMNNGFSLDFSNASADKPDFNEVHHCIINSGSFGFRIKSTNSGVLPDGNMVYNNTMITRTTGGPAFENNRAGNTLLYGNRISGGNPSVLLDKPIDGTQIYNNYIVNTNSNGKGIYGPAITGAGISIIHNSIYSDGDCFNGDNNTALDLTGTIVRNNIFHSINGICISVRNNLKFQEIDCNMYWHSASDCGKFNNTNYADLLNWQAVDHDSRVTANGDENSLETDPLFLSAATGNLDLDPSSMAIDAGCAAGITEDIYHTSRPQNGTIDIGAFEYFIDLPVKLFSFNGTCTGNEIHLAWKTAWEINNNFFTMERSENGMDFNPIGYINGSGTSKQPLLYQFTDHYQGKAYYRLKQTDFDGVYSYSEIITTGCTEDRMSVFNNSNEIVVDISATHNQDVKISLHTVTGQILYFSNRSIASGSNRITINKNSYSTGLYLITIQTDSKTITEKILLNL